MFDLKKREREWEKTCTRLSNEEILRIYQEEGVTTAEREISEMLSHYDRPTGEERLLAMLFNGPKEEKIQKQDQEIEQKKAEIRSRKRQLSDESKHKIIEGCMDLVFDETQDWYNFFNGDISMERIYYACLETLLKCVKYCVHYDTKACFRNYVIISINNNMIDRIASWEHMKRRNAREIIEKLRWTEEGKETRKVMTKEECEELGIDFHIELYTSGQYRDQFEYGYDDIYLEHMQLEKPSDIQRRLISEVDYVEMAVSNMFMADYNDFLRDNLTTVEEIVMRLLYDKDGRKKYTISELALQLKTTPEKIRTIKRSAISKIRNDKKLNMYQWYDTVKK